MPSESSPRFQQNMVVVPKEPTQGTQGNKGNPKLKVQTTKRNIVF